MTSWTPGPDDGRGGDDHDDHLPRFSEVERDGLHLLVPDDYKGGDEDDREPIDPHAFRACLTDLAICAAKVRYYRKLRDRVEARLGDPPESDVDAFLVAGRVRDLLDAARDRCDEMEERAQEALYGPVTVEDGRVEYHDPREWPPEKYAEWAVNPGVRLPDGVPADLDDLAENWEYDPTADAMHHDRGGDEE